ncbi:MFS transporter [Mesorhizobium sp. J428]|uniref:MFS transporter n=1 Tax=Mesorhizobium sp. J428 TaxID=2898440 RepID=UPI00215146E1|nr:MFS transporter [Mesorhizobium sp. J428]MCR5856082.1 MFS transporter [Mesorhizobium sp. J428]
MVERSGQRVDWRALWASGDLGLFCFVSLGILLHATMETMMATIMPALVGDLEGVTLVGWTFAIYELGAIVAGTAAGRLVSYVSLRGNMVGAATLYGCGALICALAPTMPILLAGRLIEGLGGGGLVSLAYVSVERLFARAIWPQLFGIMSAIWGVAAFSGPLLGALISTAFGWRWTFGAFAIAGVAMAAVSYVVLRMPEARRVTGDEPPPFPVPALATLACAVILIAFAGVTASAYASLALLAAGVFGLWLFFRVDALMPRSRLFPHRPFDWSTALGSGMTMVAALSVSTVSFAIYAPLLLTSLHGVPVLTTGYIIAAESIAWSILSILVAGAPPHRERLIIVGGALMITAGLAGFSVAIPAGNIPAILFCALLQGGGFGIAWPFVTRIIVASAPPQDSTVASSAVPALQRIGYATGAAAAGIVANSSGFAEGLSGETAAGVARWLFLAFLPLALIGCAAAIRMSRAG